MLTPKRILAPVSATLASALMVSISAGPAPAASEESIVLHADDVPERASSTSRVSVNGRGTQGNGESWSTSTLSASGRHVAFASEASNLVPRDTNRRSDVFVHDRVTATTKRISVSSRGRQSNGQMTDWPSISPGGRFVGFSSDASTLVRRNTHGDLHAYVRDLATGRTRLISVSTGERPGNSYSYVEGISRGGRYVAIGSDASNLVPRDTNGFDMFVRDRRTGTTRRVSVSTTGQQADGSSSDGDMSPNGRYIVFSSNAANLVAGDTNDQHDVFLRDQLAKTTTRVSVPHTEGQANGYSIAPAVSADGRYVVFVSNATNMVPGDPTDDRDIFVRDLRTGQTELVTVGLEGENASVDEYLNPAISGTGRYIAFHTDSALVPGDTNEAVDVYVRDTESDTTRRVSRSSSDTQGNAASTGPSLSATGRVTAFTSAASNLVARDTNGKQDIFVHEWLAAP